MITKESTTHLERRVRSRDPETSWVAAAGMPDVHITELQAWVMVTLRERPLTDEELQGEHGAAVFARQIRHASPQRVRTARKELQLQGLVRSTETTRPTRSGYQATVWEVTA